MVTQHQERLAFRPSATNWCGPRGMRSRILGPDPLDLAYHCSGVNFLRVHRVGEIGDVVERWQTSVHCLAVSSSRFANVDYQDQLLGRRG